MYPTITIFVTIKYIYYLKSEKHNIQLPITIYNYLQLSTTINNYLQTSILPILLDKDTII